MSSKSDVRYMRRSNKVRFRFPVHSEEAELCRDALNKAKREAGTEYDAVAFVAMCLNYLSGSAVKPPDLEEVMKANGVTEVFTAIDALWPDINIQLLADTPVVKQEHPPHDLSRSRGGCLS